MKAGAFVLTLIAGAAYELGCVFWVHHSENGSAGKASVWSCLNALVTIIGIESFLQFWWLKVAYVIGFGVGTFIAVKYEERLLTSGA